MTVGKMRHRVTLKNQPTTAVGAGGVISQTEDVIATIWGRVQPTSGVQTNAHDRLEYPVSHIVTVRYQAEYKSARFITHDSRSFKVLGVQEEEERGRWLVFNCQEGVPQ